MENRGELNIPWESVGATTERALSDTIIKKVTEYSVEFLSAAYQSILVGPHRCT